MIESSELEVRIVINKKLTQNLKKETKKSPLAQGEVTGVLFSL